MIQTIKFRPTPILGSNQQLKHVRMQTCDSEVETRMKGVVRWELAMLALVK